MNSDGRLPDDWFRLLKPIMQTQEFQSLRKFIQQERKQFNIFPAKEDIFRAFIETPFDKVKVVILGQDPYHGIGQAHGLAFSVKESSGIPPSLQNIFIELKNDIGVEIPTSGNLTKWARQGVLLINTVLTVRKGEANSHRGKGWELFTDEVIRVISQNRTGVVFILWGRPAREKINLIDTTKHFVVQAPHPSPLSAYRGFFGSSPFSKTNQYLKSIGKTPIDWKL